MAIHALQNVVPMPHARSAGTSGRFRVVDRGIRRGVDHCGWTVTIECFFHVTPLRDVALIAREPDYFDARPPHHRYRATKLSARAGDEQALSLSVAQKKCYLRKLTR